MRCAALAIGLTGLALAGCDQADMYKQGKSSTWDRSEFLPKKSSMQLPVAGTVPRDEPNQAVPQPATITVAMIERGHQRYDIFCTPCHGLAGNADGMIVQRGFPKPPLFTSDRLMKAKARDFYNVLTNGKGAMYSYADRVPPSDRWAIAAYIRALQLSQKPVIADLSPDDRAKLQQAGQ
jgi:mono/diheme cytochrome c family protein